MLSPHRAGSTSPWIAPAALLAALALGTSAVAESGFSNGAWNAPTVNTGPGGVGNINSVGGSPQQQQNGPSVFDLQKPPPPSTSKAAGSGAERYVAGEPNYNTEQREQWIKACEGEKRKSMEAFRECYEREKSRTLEGIQRKFNAVERRLKSGGGGDDTGSSSEEP